MTGKALPIVASGWVQQLSHGSVRRNDQYHQLLLMQSTWQLVRPVVRTFGLQIVGGLIWSAVEAYIDLL